MANLRFGIGSKMMKLLSLVLLIIILFVGGSFLLKHCSKDNAPIVPLVQNEEKLETPGIISDNGDLLLPVAEVARSNFFQAEIFIVKNENNLLQQQIIALLPVNQSGTGYTISYYVDDADQVSGLAISQGGQPVVYQGEPTLHRNLLYLPVDFFNTAFGLQVDLTDDGKAILTPANQGAAQPSADPEGAAGETPGGTAQPPAGQVTPSTAEDQKLDLSEPNKETTQNLPEQKQEEPQQLPQS